MAWLGVRHGMLAVGLGSLAAGVISTPVPTPKPRAKTIEFNRDIRPVITKCFTCHGHDPAAVAAGLRLDVRDSATSKMANGKTAIVPGHPEKSEVIERVFAKDEAVKMPPAYSNKVLSADEKELLRRWIEEGAEYKEHWGFVKPVRPPVPAVKQKSWPKSPIDGFILAKLESKGLRPSPEADRRTLIRRVSLDLTGLPPTPKEVDAFLADRSPNAYEKVVDRLLASPRYGERMAMDWMDYARYADSNGYQADFERFQWRWRDWVLDAFNKNMPYDRFALEQLAGDLLPHPTLSQMIATGFNRNHRINTEGGVVPEEWRVETVIDRVETTSTVFLGLTTGCARCHDHKYDPFSQKEFYSLFAYFNNVPESGTGDEQPVNHPPLIKAPTPGQEKQLKAYDSRLAALKQAMAERLAANSGKSDHWTFHEAEPMPSLSEGLVARYRLGVNPVAEIGPAAKAEGPILGDGGRSTGAVATNDKAFVDLGDVGGFDAKEPFSYALWVNPDKPSGAPISRMDPAHDFRGWDLYLQEGRPTLHLISVWPDNALKVISKEVVPVGQWSHVAVTYDGSEKIEGVAIYVNGRKVETTFEKKSLSGSTKADVHAKIGRRNVGDVYYGKVDDLAFYSRVLKPAEAAKLASVHPARPLLLIPLESRTKDQKRTLDRLWSRENDAVFRRLDDEQAALATARKKLDDSITTVMVMQEMPNPRQAHVLLRGQYDKIGPPVSAGLPKALPAMPKGAPNNRLGLAEWIVSPENPLTARVTVNRMWERLFGTGIVETVEDFGTRAEFPSHPELLDWLATELMAKKWSLKAIWKELVMSSTYRQSSSVTPKLLQIDPANRLLARGPRFRLPAEVIRDQAMLFGGTLVEKIGGPSVRPYQPEGIWDEVNFYGNLKNYKPDMGPGRYRRSLYTIWKRTASPPNMTLFDVPSRETCRVRRARTDTPLQALALMNDVTYVESARALAMRMLREGGQAATQQIRFAFRTVLCRKPSPEELQILSSGFVKRLSYYKSNPASAEKLLKQGDLPNDPKLDKATLAAATITASTILNLDEAVTKE